MSEHFPLEHGMLFTPPHDFPKPAGDLTHFPVSFSLLRQMLFKHVTLPTPPHNLPLEAGELPHVPILFDPAIQSPLEHVIPFIPPHCFPIDTGELTHVPRLLPSVRQSPLLHGMLVAQGFPRGAGDSIHLPTRNSLVSELPIAKRTALL